MQNSTTIDTLYMDEIAQLDALSIQAKEHMRQVAQDIAQDFAQQLQQAIQQHTDALITTEGMGEIALSPPTLQDGQGWFAQNLSSVLNQTIIRLAAGKTLTNKAAITAIFQQPARQFGKQLGEDITHPNNTALRMNANQGLQELWDGLQQSFLD